MIFRVVIRGGCTEMAFDFATLVDAAQFGIYAKENFKPVYHSGFAKELAVKIVFIEQDEETEKNETEKIPTE